MLISYEVALSIVRRLASSRAFICSNLACAFLSVRIFACRPVVWHWFYVRRQARHTQERRQQLTPTTFASLALVAPDTGGEERLEQSPFLGGILGAGLLLLFVSLSEMGRKGGLEERSIGKCEGGESGGENLEKEWRQTVSELSTELIWAQ